MRQIYHTPSLRSNSFQLCADSAEIHSVFLRLTLVRSSRAVALETNTLVRRAQHAERTLRGAVEIATVCVVMSTVEGAIPHYMCGSRRNWCM